MAERAPGRRAVVLLTLPLSQLYSIGPGRRGKVVSGCRIDVVLFTRPLHTYSVDIDYSTHRIERDEVLM